MVHDLDFQFMKSAQFFAVALTALIVLQTSVPEAAGAPIAQESFGYAAGQLVGGAGGSGFSGAWAQGGFNASQSANYSVSSPGLNFSTLAASCNRAIAVSATSISGVTRSLATPIGAQGTTQFFSFLMRPEGTLGQGAFNGFFGLVLESPTEPELFIGKSGSGDLGHYLMEQRGGGAQTSSTVVPTVGQSAFFVVKAEFLAGNDRFTLYMNPTPGGIEPIGGVVKQDLNVGTISGLTLYSSGAYSIDELRVGETFLDVAPVPEPSKGMFGALGGLLFLLARVRKKQRRMLRSPCVPSEL
jgi:hypothetical protein